MGGAEAFASLRHMTLYLKAKWVSLRTTNGTSMETFQPTFGCVGVSENEAILGRCLL